MFFFPQNVPVPKTYCMYHVKRMFNYVHGEFPGLDHFTIFFDCYATLMTPSRNTDQFFFFFSLFKGQIIQFPHYLLPLI